MTCYGCNKKMRCKVIGFWDFQANFLSSGLYDAIRRSMKMNHNSYNIRLCTDCQLRAGIAHGGCNYQMQKFKVAKMINSMLN